MKKTVLTCILLAIIIPVSAFAGGFNIYEHSARASGMGGAFIAYGSGPSCIFFNPAGISNVQGTSIEAGATALYLSSTFYGPLPNYSKTSIKDKIHPPAHAYIVHSLTDKINVGFGFFTPFGLGLSWPSDWQGRYIITELDLKTYYFNPTASYKFSDKFSIGAGFSYIMSSATLRKKANYTPRSLDGLLDFSGDGSATCFNVGFQAKPNDKFAVGASYRSKADLKFDDGTAKFDFPTISSAIINTEIADMFPTVSGKTTIHLPDILAVGIGFKPADKLTCEFGYVWFGWENYNELVITIPEEEQTDAVKTLESEKNYKNVAQIRFGLEYEYTEKLKLRAGYIYDPTPVPDETLEPLLPDADRNDFSCGFGYNFGTVNLDVYYMWLKFNKNTTLVNLNHFNGSYKTDGHLFGMTFSYGFK